MTAEEMILAERQRQIAVEGWTAEHDDSHDNGELLTAAVLYYSWASWLTELRPRLRADGAPVGWPWEAKWWKPGDDPVRTLVKAGALCIAERERLTRLDPNRDGGHVLHKYNGILRALQKRTGEIV